MKMSLQNRNDLPLISAQNLSFGMQTDISKNKKDVWTNENVTKIVYLPDCIPRP
jgi:hypothetical protein